LFVEERPDWNNKQENPFLHGILARRQHRATREKTIYPGGSRYAPTTPCPGVKTCSIHSSAKTRSIQMTPEFDGVTGGKNTSNETTRQIQGCFKERSLSSV
jgi:hypothetical protein